MSVAATKRYPGVWENGKWFEVDADIVFSNNYGTGGETLDLRGVGLPGNAIPRVVVTGKAGFVYQYAPGTNLGDGKLMIRVATTSGANLPLAEHSAAAVDAAVIADSIIATIRVPKYKA